MPKNELKKALDRLARKQLAKSSAPQSAGEFFAPDTAMLKKFLSKLPAQDSDYRAFDAASQSFVIKHITDITTLQKVQKKLAKAYAAGLSWQDAREDFLELGVDMSHLKTVFATNLRSAYNEARREEQMASSKPFLRYVSVGDSRVRDEHAAWHGLILPKDDSWWDEHYPPSGFNCRCYVQALSAREAGKYGYKDSGGERIKPAVTQAAERIYSKRVDELTQYLNDKAKSAPASLRKSINQRIKKVASELSQVQQNRKMINHFYNQILKGEAVAKANYRLGSYNGKPLFVSTDTLATHAFAHPNVRQAEYALIPLMLKNVIISKPSTSTDGALVISSYLGKAYRIVIKDRQDGVFVATLERERAMDKKWRRSGSQTS